jgi:hypothetical protein
MESKAMDIVMSIELNKDEVIADIHFFNNSPEIVYLDTWTIGKHKILTNSIFSITDENNRSVFYSGMMGSRDVEPEDFISLNPGESITTRIIISKDYKLSKGHKYSIRFSAYNPTYLGKQSLMELLSNKVEITY